MAWLWNSWKEGVAPGYYISRFQREPCDALQLTVLTFKHEELVMTQVAIELPEDIASRLGLEEDLSNVTLRALAAQAYRDGQLTHAEVQRVLGFASRWETDAFLKQAGANLDYTEADLDNDLAASRRISPA